MLACLLQQPLPSGLNKRLNKVFLVSGGGQLKVMITDDTTPVHLKNPGQKLQHSRQLSYQHARLGESWGRTPYTLLTAPEYQSLKMSFVRALKPCWVCASSSASPTVMTQNPPCTAGCTHWVWILPAPLARHSPTIKDQSN